MHEAEEGIKHIKQSEHGLKYHEYRGGLALG